MSQKTALFTFKNEGTHRKDMWIALRSQFIGLAPVSLSGLKLSFIGLRFYAGPYASYIACRITELETIANDHEVFGATVDLVDGTPDQVLEKLQPTLTLVPAASRAA